MKYLLLLFSLVSCVSTNSVSPTSSPSQFHPQPMSIFLSRYIAVSTCQAGKKKCSAPVAKNLPSANIQLDMGYFSKGGETGLSAFDAVSVTENGVPFTGEIRITKKDGADEYYVYMLLRSGPSIARQGKVKTFSIKSLENLQKIQLEDEPIQTEKGTLKATFIVGPKLANQ